ncbi:autotransporter domain-containing protein [Kaistia sp. UC242_56]|uniref:autotransporter domain-containing protein n=1 Tax=Kaistia sp. UC242_56 TaxID=3374625 RepID=UPI0037B735A7
MSETIRNTGRKAWLLSSASGAVLLAGMAVMTPEQALAACTSGNVVNCTGANSFNSTRSYIPTGAFTLNFGDGTALTTVTATGSGANADGIRILGGTVFGVPYGTSNPVTVNLPVLSSVNANRDGLFTMTDGRDNSINITASGNITAQRTGIVAVSGNALGAAGAGGISIANSGSIQASSGPAILAYRQNSTNSDLNQTVAITNSGTLKSVSGDGIVVGNSVGNPYGLGATVRSEGMASIVNNKTIDVAGNGIWSNTTSGATISNGVAGEIAAGQDGVAAYGVALGVELATGGDVEVENLGSLEGRRHGVHAITEGDVIVSNGAGARIEGTGGDGIRLGSLGDATVYNDGGSITGGDNGVSAVAAGKLFIDNRSTGVDASTIQGVSSGIRFGTTVGGVPIPHVGDVEIQNGADDIIRATAGDGITGLATGQIDIVNLSGGTIDGATNGINVTSLLSGVNIANGGDITAGQNGIVAIAGLGNVVIDGEDDGAGGKIYGSVDATNGSGIFGAALGNGDVSIDAGTVNAGADNAFTIPGLGIGVGGGVVGVALGDGAVDVRLHGNVSVDGGMFGGAAIALGTGHAIVTLDDGVDIDPPVIGMAAISVNGNSTVNIGNNSNVDATLAGAVGLNFGAGGITVDVGDNSTIGDATVPTFGILTLDTSGSAPTEITIGTDSVVNGQTSAILAIAAGSGSKVSIANNGGAIIGGDGSAPVIGVYSDSGVVIDNNNYDDGTNVHRGLIQNASEAPDDLAILTGGGQMTLNNNGDVIGRVIALTTNGGDNAFNNDEGSTWKTSGASTFITTGSGSNTLTNALGAEVDLSNGMITLGAIGGDNTLANNGSFDVIGAAMFNLGSVSGDNFVQNSGGFTSQGAVMFNLGSVSGSNDFSNTGEMTFTGLHAFNFGSVNGNNTVTNDGVFETYGLTAFNFAAGGTSTFNNNDYFSTNGVTSFLGLDDFNNNGMLTMVNGQYDYGLMTMPGTETHVGDWTLIDGNFVAGPDSSLAVDARLSVKGDSASDLLSITGDVVGTTKVYVNYDTSAIGGYNPDGITVARVWSGNTSEGDFKLANGPIDRGLYTYDLFLKSEAEGGGMSPMAETEGGASWVLASYADASAYNLSAFTGLAQGVWNTTSDSWIDRAGDLRVSAEGTDPSKRSGIWGRMIGNGANRSTDATITPFQNQSVKIDTGYDQTLWGFQAGIDHEFEGTVADGVLVAGVLAGYVTSNVDFDNGESVKLSGPQVGVYATWVKGGLYVDGLVKGDFLKADYNVGGADDSTDSTTIGVRVESGYRFLTSTGMFIEPNASLAYAHTKFDDINVSGTAVNFDNGDGLEGKLGARFGGSTLKDGVKYDPYVSLGIAGELLSNNSVFLDSGPGLVVEDDAPDVFGEVGAGINIFSSKSGWTGFAKADLRFGDDYFGGTGKIGARWAW